MEISFTRHAIKRIEERGIYLKEVAECIFFPDKVRKDLSTTIYTKLDVANNKLLILVCIVTDERCKIITAIKTSKIDKYS